MDEKPEVFLETFEQMAEVYQLPQDLLAIQLGPYLAGETLAAEATYTYDTWKSAILDHVGLMEDVYRQQFHATGSRTIWSQFSTLDSGTMP